MKKIEYLSVIVISSFILGSCGAKSVLPDSNAACEARVNDYEKALNAFAADPTNVSKCNAAKTATEKLISACTLYTVAQRKVYEDALKDWKCN
jgi:hypothetical protein